MTAHPAPPPAAAARPARGEAPGAIATGIVAAAAWLGGAAIEREELPFGEHGRAGWWTIAALLVLVALLARRVAASPRGRAAVAAIAAFALAGAAVAREFAGQAVAGALLPAVIAAACALALGTPRLQRRHPAPFAAAAVAALAFAWAWPRLLGAGHDVVFLLATLAALPLLARAEPAPALRSRPASSWRIGLRAAALVGAAVLLVLAMAALASLPPPCFPGSEVRVLATRGELTVVYVRAIQELRLYDGAVLVDASGPDRAEGPLATTLLNALLWPGDRVLVLGIGGGRTAAGLQRQGRFVVDCVDRRPAARELQALLAADGPVPAPPGAAGALAARSAGTRRALAALGDGMRQAILLAEPLAPASCAQIRAQHELRRVAGAGPVLQLVALDHALPRPLHDLFAAARAAHAWNGLFVVGDAAVLVSAAHEPRWPAMTPFTAWCDDARWAAHEAHLGGLADLRSALLGTLGDAVPPPPEAAAGGRAAALAVVRAWLRPAPEPPASSEPRVLARWSARGAEVRAASASMRQLGDDGAARAQAQSIAARFLPVGAPAAALQAALALPAADGTTLLSAALACRRAHAIDPTFFQSPPAVCAGLPRPADGAGALEDQSALPPAQRLAALCSGEDPLAVALRVRFASRCARALVERLVAGPLPPPAMGALRELADPFVLAEAANVLAARAGLRELLGAWRLDLAMPPQVALLLAGDDEDRRALAAALRGRREPSCHAVLAALLEGEDVPTRRLAGEALWHAVGDRVPYEADWPLSARREAAQRLRALHNRTP